MTSDIEKEARKETLRKRMSYVAALMAMLLVASACSPAAEEAPAPTAAPAETCDPEVIKIGALYPLTGGAAAVGEKVLHGVQLAAEIVNGEYPELTLPLAAEAGLPNLCNSTLEILAG